MQRKKKKQCTRIPQIRGEKLNNRKTQDKISITVIKTRQLPCQASVIVRCGALVLMCLFSCKQLFLYFLILMITRSCVIFGSFLPPLNLLGWRGKTKAGAEQTVSLKGSVLITIYSTKIAIFSLFSGGSTDKNKPILL